MGTCLSCGKKSLSLKTIRCRDCGRLGCSCCIRYVMFERREGSRLGESPSGEYIHKGCRALGARRDLEEAERVASEPHLFERKSIESLREQQLVFLTAISLIPRDIEHCVEAAQKFRRWAPIFGAHLEQKASEADSKAEFLRRVHLEYAEELERDSKVQEAADIYESYGMLGEAARLRRSGLTGMAPPK